MMHVIDKVVDEYIRYDSPHSLCEFAVDFPSLEYIQVHGFKLPREEKPFDLESITNGSIVFIKWDFVNAFISKLLPALEHRMQDKDPNAKIILITGRGDMCVDLLSTKLLTISPIIHKWFRTNPIGFDPTVEFFPIGFGEVERPHGSVEMLRYFDERPVGEKINKIYVPWHNKDHNSSRTEKLSTFVNKHRDMCVVEESKLKQDEYMNKLSQYKYCLSLCGNGFDVHRNYECILTSTIPVIENSPVREGLHHTGISYTKVEDFKETEFDSESRKIIRYDYWYNKLRKIQENLRR